MTSQEPQKSPYSPWEDTLIIAVRDMQWQLLQERQKQAGSASPAMSLPPPLLKFDDIAETRTGDALTSHEDRFFLFEFKRDLGAAIKDRTKPMWAFIEEFDYANTEHQSFLTLSRRCHRFLYANMDRAEQAQARTLTMESLPYYDIVKHVQFCNEWQGLVTKDGELTKLVNELDSSAPGYKARLAEYEADRDCLEKKKSAAKNAAKNAVEQHKTYFQDAFPFSRVGTSLRAVWTTSDQGASFVEICAYIQVLNNAVGTGDDAPVKCAIATAQGLILPIASLRGLFKDYSTFLGARQQRGDDEFGELVALTKKLAGAVAKRFRR
ncbi:hypothetical protein [Massilia sp. METH4]|uniref:hypothetical protein n=1 Tax=Massilia sp. METH4 TaxID=3123041 RepID=UPI0030CC7C69